MSRPAQLQDTVRQLLADDDSRGVFLVLVVIGALSGGYAAGSVLAGEPVTQQDWLVPVALGLGTALLALLHTTDETDV